MSQLDFTKMSDEELQEIASGAFTPPQPTDFSQMSNEELQSIASGNVVNPPSMDFSQMSDEELQSIAYGGVQYTGLTEDTIRQDRRWIDAAYKVYEMNEGPDAVKLNSDKQAAEYALDYMGWFNYNLPKMGLEAAQLGSATDEQKKSFVTLMDMYDEKEVSASGLYRAAKGLVFDPTTYAGIATFGGATAGAQALKEGIRQGIKQGTKAGLKQGAKIGAIEGAAYSALDSLGRETARVQADTQEGIDFGNIAKAAGAGAVLGGTLGGGLGAAGGRASAKKYSKQSEIKELVGVEKKLLEGDNVDVGSEVVPYSTKEAQRAVQQMAETTEDFAPSPTLDLSQKGIDIALEFMSEMDIPAAPTSRISDQIFDVLQLVSQSDEYKDVFTNVLKRNNINEVELSQIIKLSGSDAGKRLNQLSRASKALERVANELSGNVPKEPWSFPLLRKFQKGASELDNVRRGLLVSQVATSARNFTAQVGRVGMHTLTQGVDNALNQTFNPVRKLFGKETVDVDHSDTFRLLLNLTRDKKTAKNTTDFVTKYFAGEKDRLFSNYASDVADASKNTTFKRAAKITDGLNTLNRMQEFYYRNGMFAASLEESLKKRGLDLNKIVDAEDIRLIPVEDIQKAVDDALDFTYAKTPDGGIGEAFVKFTNSIPFVTTAVFPFGRFMANAMKFQFRHSPLGPLSFLSESERAAFAKGDSKIIAQSLVGTAAFLTAIQMKRASEGETKWYEIQLENGQPVDMRPYFPLTPYMLVADIIVSAERGISPPPAKDIIAGLTGAQLRGGAGLGFVDNFMKDLSGLDNEEKITNFVTRFVADVAGGFLTPVRMFGDFIDSLPEELGGVKRQSFKTTTPKGKPDVLGLFSTEDFGQAILRNIPIANRGMEELRSPTRASPRGRPETTLGLPAPLVRQLTGVTVGEAKNPAEKEFDRLNYKMSDIRPYSGERKVDRLMDKHMGAIVEYVISPIVQSEAYKEKSNARKDKDLRRLLKEIRAVAKQGAVVEDPKAFLRRYIKRQPNYNKRIIQEENPDIYKLLME